MIHKVLVNSSWFQVDQHKRKPIFSKGHKFFWICGFIIGDGIIDGNEFLRRSVHETRLFCSNTHWLRQWMRE